MGDTRFLEGRTDEELERLAGEEDEIRPAIEEAFEPLAEPENPGDQVADGTTDVDSDGWIFDIHTGEILGRADAPEAFTVDTIAKAEWALELRSRIEGEVAGIDARIAAVTGQLRALRAEKLRRLSWWTWKYEPSLVAFARKLLEGRKGKTLRLGWGSIAFRQTQGSHQILDMEAAVNWMKAIDPGKVKVVEKVGIKDVLKARARDGDGGRLPWLASSAGGEVVKISTGIDLDHQEEGKAIR